MSAKPIVLIVSTINLLAVTAVLTGLPPPTAPKDDAPLPRTDRYGDPLPARALARMGTVRSRAGMGVSSLCLSRDERFAVSAGDGGVHLWEVATGKEVRRLQEDSAAVAVFSADGSRVVVARWDRVSTWETSGKNLANFKVHGGERYINTSFALSADGAIMATICSDPRTLVLWDTQTGKPLRQWEAVHADGDLALSPDGKVLASCDKDDIIRLWDTTTGRSLSTLPAKDLQVSCLVFSPDGKALVAGGTLSSDAADPEKPTALLVLWDVATGKELRRLDKGERGRVTSLAFSAQGTSLASVNFKTVTVLDVATLKERHSFQGHWGRIGPIAFFQDARTLIGEEGNGTIFLRDVATGREKTPNPEYRTAVDAVAWRSDGRTALICGYDTVRVWDATTGRELRRFGPVECALARPGSGAAFSPDGTLLAAIAWNAAGESFDFQLWDVAGGKKLRESPTTLESVADVVFSPNGKVVGVAGGNGLGLWDVATCRELHCLRHARTIGTENNVCSVAFSPDGKLVATGDDEEALYLWELETLVKRAEFPIEKNESIKSLGDSSITCLAYSPDGQFLAAKRGPESIGLWEMATLKPCGSIPCGYPAQRLAFSPSGQILASTGKGTTIDFWAMVTGKRVDQLQGHRGRIHALAFSGDGQKLLSGSEDTTAVLWDTQPRRPTTEPVEEGRWGPGTAQALWGELGSTDAARAYQTVRDLLEYPQQSLALMKQRLRPVAPPETKKVAQLLSDLDAKDFPTRRDAAMRLEKLEDRVELALQKALLDRPPLEVRQRIEQLLNRLKPPISSADILRSQRAVIVLEHIGTSEAAELLDTLGGGAEGARLTCAAQAARKRLAMRPARQP